MRDALTPEDAIRLFGMANQLVETDLDRVERELNVDLGRAKPSRGGNESHDFQFSRELREEAAAMARHYEMFYCLENSIRALVRSALNASAHGGAWWNACVSETIRNEVKLRIQRETDSGVTLRSDDPLDYTTFGELGEIIKSNWDVFGALLNSQKAVASIMTRLNQLRGPIAHCSELVEDEIDRLNLTVRDWFRQMEAQSREE